VSQDLVSVYLPTFNRVDLLKRAASSVLGQTYGNIELLIVDDGSNDGTNSYLKRLASEDARVRILKKNGPKGAPASRNIAIENATGKYITGLDDDDYFSSDHVKILFEAYESTWSCCFARKSNWKDWVFSPVFSVIQVVNFKQLAYFNFIGNQVFTETWKMKEIGGFDENLPAAQDYDTWLTLVRKFGSAKAVRSNSYIVDLNHDGERITDNFKNKIISYEYICKKHGFSDNEYIAGSFLIRRACLDSECVSSIPIKSLFNVRNFRYFKRLFNKPAMSP
jgi:glycosyltransferase involved in cell wall biosynthesis